MASLASRPSVVHVKQPHWEEGCERSEWDTRLSRAWTFVKDDAPVREFGVLRVRSKDRVSTRSRGQNGLWNRHVAIPYESMSVAPSQGPPDTRHAKPLQPIRLVKQHLPQPCQATIDEPGCYGRVRDRCATRQKHRKSRTARTLSLAVGGLLLSGLPQVEALHHLHRPAIHTVNARDSDLPLHVTNNCGDVIYAAILTQSGSGPTSSGFRLAPGDSNPQSVSADWRGRVWGRTNCTFSASGSPPSSGQGGAACMTGDCGRFVECQGAVSNIKFVLTYRSLLHTGSTSRYAGRIHILFRHWPSFLRHLPRGRIQHSHGNHFPRHSQLYQRIRRSTQSNKPRLHRHSRPLGPNWRQIRRRVRHQHILPSSTRTVRHRPLRPSLVSLAPAAERPAETGRWRLSLPRRQHPEATLQPLSVALRQIQQSARLLYR